ncbi:DUF6988 family protein [Aliivibrio fischeri]|uniref:Uncharacterized protein n=1 Tax=Aliivibrio fischeri SR5 TaxID=1088719 RepID=A0AAV3EM62_ALIFS|nr:DUF5677 domain-containing protein [Aliivibrio fischeri]EHN68040.1 hypothetical protein VFSR5_A0621 [Aliivibrio fischeri SR5]
MYKILNNYAEVKEFISNELKSLKFTTNEPKIKAGSVLCVSAIDHCEASIELIKLKRISSSFALIRVAYEAFIRGSWLINCATAEQAERFINHGEIKNGSKNIYTRDLVKMIDDKVEFNGLLTNKHDEYWTILNSFTHSGEVPLAYGFDGSSVKSCYTEEQIDEMVHVVTFVSTFSFMALLDICDNKDALELVEKLKLKLSPWHLTKQSTRC